MPRRRQRPRNYFTYYFKVGRKIVHKGRTDNLERREQEHKQKWPSGHIFKVGHRKTEEGAKKWEKKQGAS